MCIKLRLVIFLFYLLALSYNFLTRRDKGDKMDGTIMVTYKILCKNDVKVEISLNQLLSNEKIVKLIKSEFSKGIRNLELSANNENSDIEIATVKELYNFEVQKDDFADILVLAEEDASNKKLIKKDCDRIELVDIETT